MTLEEMKDSLVQSFLKRLNKAKTEYDKILGIKALRNLLALAELDKKLAVAVEVRNHLNGEKEVFLVDGTEDVVVDKEDKVSLDGRFLLYNLQENKEEIIGGAA